MKRRTLFESTGGGIDPSLSAACDICFYNNKRQEIEIITKDQWNTGGTTVYPATTYTPIGVVVVPGTHGVLKDGNGKSQCGVMSLKNMSYSTPDTGTTGTQFICWGGYNIDTPLTNYNKVVTASSASSNNANSYTTGNAYLPINGSYINTTYCPSPYIGSDLKSGGFNPAYSDTTAGTTANGLSDFDGPGNTAVLTSLATAQSNWRIASTITNNSGSGYYPAACCCWRYHTTGTQQGDWYMPSCGELGYAIIKTADINNTIEELKTAYGSSIGCKLADTYAYFSSTEYDKANGRSLGFVAGGLDIASKNTNYRHVRAFLRV